MFIFFKLAIGNIIKNMRTSITILVVIFVCVFFMQFGVAFTDGFKTKLTGDYLNEAGHINIYNKTYYKEMDYSMNEYSMKLGRDFTEKIKNFPGVKEVKAEINFGVIANTETRNLECVVRAIDIEKAADNYSKLAASVIKGSFIKNKNDIIIGQRGAMLLGLKPGDKLVLLSVDQYGSISAVEGVISGIYKTFSAQLDERGLVCGLPLAQKLLGMENAATKISVILNDPFASIAVSEQLNKILPPEITAIPWQVEQEFMVSYLKILNSAVYFIAFIIIFGASMGIINSFLMNIMNRMPEFGALRAMGLGKAQMFLMITVESFVLGVIGTVLGMIPGTITVLYFQAHPFNYEQMFRTMQGSAIGNLDASMGTVFLPASAAVIVLTGILISVIASSYPAMIAINKKPADIMRVTE
jgi:putative ABC transport system permease protein